MMDHVFPVTLLDNITLNAQAYRETPILDLRHIDRIESVMIRCRSASATPHVRAEFVVNQNVDDTSGWTAYGTHDTLMASCTSSFTRDGVAVGTEEWQTYSMPNPLALFIKFRVLGLGINPVNPADTTVDFKVLLREVL